MTQSTVAMQGYKYLRWAAPEGRRGLREFRLLSKACKGGRCLPAAMDQKSWQTHAKDIKSVKATTGGKRRRKQAAGQPEATRERPGRNENRRLQMCYEDTAKRNRSASKHTRHAMLINIPLHCIQVCNVIFWPSNIFFYFSAYPCLQMLLLRSSEDINLTKNRVRKSSIAGPQNRPNT